MTDDSGQPHDGGAGQGADPRLATSGAITYLHIPATDVRRAAAFYDEVFGWHIHDPDGRRPSFDTPNGRLSGAWVTDHPPAAEPGLLPYIYVDDLADSIARILEHGGEIVTRPFAEGILRVATFRDPSANVIGLWHDTSRPA